MNPGFSLLEFLVATSFFCVILLGGYAMLDSQQFLTVQMASRTWPEQAANYRILVIRNLLQDSSAGFRQDALTGGIPSFFRGLHFDDSPEDTSFSVAIPKGSPHRFLRDAVSGAIQTEAIPDLKLGGTLALGGNCGDHFCWSYATVKAIRPQELDLDFVMAGEIPEAGSLIRADLYGFSYENNTLYWISPAGLAEPFWPSLEEFQYEYNNGQLTLSWKTSMTNGRSVIDL